MMRGLMPWMATGNLKREMDRLFGLLTVTLPKTSAAQGTTIPIKAE